MVGPEITRRLPYYEGMRLSLCQCFGIGLFLGGSLVHNFGTRRPLNSSLLKHFVCLVGGYFVGNEGQKLLDNKRNQRVGIVEDYICKHPEDFPLVKPKKYKDLLLPWTPIR